MTMILIRYTGDAPRGEREITGRGKRWWPGELRPVSTTIAAQLIAARAGFEIERGSDASDLAYVEDGAVKDGTGASVSGGGSSLRNNSLVAIVGNSHQANWTTVDAGQPATFWRTRYARGMLSWAFALSDYRLEPVITTAIAGARVTDTRGVTLLTPFVNQIDTALAAGAAHLVLGGPINDITAAIPLADIKAAYLTILDKAVKAGVSDIWWLTEPPIADGNYTVAIYGQLMHMNDWIRQWAYANLSGTRVHVVDVHAILVDPTSATGAFRANYSADNLHARNLGCYYAGKEIARRWMQSVPELPFLLTSATDQYGYSANCSNLLDNGLFLAGSPTGTGWSITTSNASNTPSIVANADGFGNSQRLDMTFTAAGSVTLSSASVHTRVQNGDKLFAACKVAVPANTILSRVSHDITVQGATTAVRYGLMGAAPEANDIAIPEAYIATLRTPIITVDTSVVGALSNVQTRVQPGAVAAGTAQIDVGRAVIRKVLF